MVRRFLVQVEASREFLRQAPQARDLVRDMLREKASGPLYGPRGGRYVAINEPYDFRESEGDFTRNVQVFTARVAGKYIRPSRTTGYSL